MAGLFWAQDSTEITIGTTKFTILQVKAPANQRLLIHEWSISFSGLSPTDPNPLVTVEQQTSSPGGSGNNPKKWNPGDFEAVQATGSENLNGSTQPAVTNEIFGEETVGYTWIAPYGQEIPVKGGTYLGITVTSSIACKAKARFRGEE